MKTNRIPDETFEFSYVARQNVTLLPLLVDYLEWHRYTKEEIKAHLHALNDVCSKVYVKPRK